MSLLGSGSVHMVGRLAKPLAAQPGSKPGGAQQVCQRCLQQGHWTYQCTAPAATYIPRPSRTKQLKNPKVRQRFLDASELPELRSAKQIEADEKRKAQEAKEAKRKRKEKRRQQSSSSSSSSSSDSDSDTSSSGSDSDTSTSSSDSGSSSSSDSDSSSGSDSSGSGSSSSSSDGSSSSDSESSGASDDSGSRGRRKQKRKGSRASPPINGAARHRRASASPDARGKHLKRGRSESPAAAARHNSQERQKPARSRSHSQEHADNAGKDAHAGVGGGLRRGTPSPGRWMGSDHDQDEDVHAPPADRERRGEYRRSGSGRRRTKVVSAVRQASPARLERQRSGGDGARGSDRHDREEPRVRRARSRERSPVRRARSP